MKNENEFTGQPVVLNCKENPSLYLRKTPDNLSMERDQKEEIVDFKLLDHSPEIVLDNLRSQGKKIVYMELLDSSNDMIVDVKPLEPSHKMDDYDLTLPIEFGRQSFSHSDISTKRLKTQLDTRPKPPNHDLVWKDSLLAKKEGKGDNGKVYPPISRESSLESVLFQINFENDMTFDGEANHLNWNENSPVNVESNLKWVKQELSSKGKQEPIDEEFKLQRTNEDSMPELKQEIQTSDEFFGDSEDTEFLPSINQVKQEPIEEEFKLQRTSEDLMPELKQEIQTSDEFFGDSEDTEFLPSISKVKQELSSKRKQEPTDEEFKLQRTSEDLMPELKQEIKTSDEFFGDSEDTEFPPSISQTTKLTGIPKIETEDENISGKRSGSNSPIQKRIKIQKKIEPFVCNYCDMKFSQTEYLSEHIKSFHETSEPCKCLHCGYTCLCKKELSRHIITVHKELEHFKCPNCELVFSSRLDLYKHKNMCPFLCTYCDYSCRFKWSLLKHIKLIHKSEFPPFKCLSCNYACSSKIDLQEHNRSNHIELKLVCKDCNVKFSENEHLLEHIKLIHETSELCRCLHCEFTCTCQNELPRHIITVHKEMEQIKCSNCELSFSCKLDLSKHRKTCTSKCIFKCLSCNYASSSSKRNLLRHIKAVHEKIERFFCKYCKEEFSLKENFLNHMKEVHDNIEQFFCKFCKEEFSLREHLLNHLKSIHKSEFLTFKCLSCNYASSSKRNLLRHIKAVHENIKRFFCKYCKEEFSRKGSLLKHIKLVHETSELCKCPQCEYTCIGIKELSSHIITVHKELTQFKCPNCKLAFRHRLDLLKHRKTSASKCIFKCLSCNYTSSSSKQKLLRHINAVHEKIERFFCKNCKEEFSQRENLLNHVKAVHEIEFPPFKCLSCSYASSNKINLQEHINSAHRQIYLGAHYCNDCKLNFVKKEHLLAHIKSIHETSDPCKCLHCEFTCTCQKELSRHIITVHEELEHFKCPTCELVFSSMADLSKHMKIYPYMCPYCDYSYGFEFALKNHLTVVHANTSTRRDWQGKKP